MDGEGICDVPGSEDIADLYRSRAPLIRSHCVKLVFWALSILLPFSLLSNALLFSRPERFDSLTAQQVATRFLSLGETPGLSIAATLIGSAVTAWALCGAAHDRGWPRTVREGVLFGVCYLVAVFLSRFAVVGDGPTLSSVGLVVVHASSLVLVARRLTTPLVPSPLTGESRELYLRNLRHIDRTALTVGFGLILTILLAVAPTGSAPLPRFTAVLLSGPVALALLAFLAVGVLRIRRIEESVLGRSR